MVCYGVINYQKVSNTLFALGIYVNVTRIKKHDCLMHNNANVYGAYFGQQKNVYHSMF